MILMPDTIIDRLNIWGKYQQEILVFTECKANSLEMTMLISHECMGMGIKLGPAKN